MNLPSVEDDDDVVLRRNKHKLSAITVAGEYDGSPIFLEWYPPLISVAYRRATVYVRYDGGHKRNEFLVDVLALVCELVPVCPEVAIGLGVPRPPIRLLGDLTRPHARGVENNELDVTAALTQYAAHMAREINEISGYVFKSKSPSCGIRGVKVHVPGARSASTGVGVFAHEFTALQLLLPVEDEARLAPPGLRDCFIERVFAYRRW